MTTLDHQENTATPRVTILRGTVPTYTARVSHVARNCGDVVLVDVRDLSGRLIRATGGNVPELILRAKKRTGLIMSSQGYGGELVVDLTGFDASAYPSAPPVPPLPQEHHAG